MLPGHGGDARSASLERRDQMIAFLLVIPDPESLVT